MNDGSNITTSTLTPISTWVQAPNPYAAWLGAAAPHIAAAYAAAPLPLLVEAVLAELTSAGRQFTAYDVTMVLRALFPGQRPLPHYDRTTIPGVQPEVHSQMDLYLADGSYSVTTVYPNGVDPARLYAPAKGKRRGRGGGWLKLLPAPGASSGAAPLPIGAWVIKGGAY